MDLPRCSGGFRLPVFLIIVWPLTMTFAMGQRCDVRTGHIVERERLLTEDQTTALTPTSTTSAALPSMCGRGHYCRQHAAHNAHNAYNAHNAHNAHGRCRRCRRCPRWAGELVKCTARHDTLCSLPSIVEALHSCLLEPSLQQCGQFRVWIAQDAEPGGHVLQEKVSSRLAQLRRQCRQSRQPAQLRKMCGRWRDSKDAGKATALPRHAVPPPSHVTQSRHAVPPPSPLTESSARTEQTSPESSARMEWTSPGQCSGNSCLGARNLSVSGRAPSIPHTASPDFKTEVALSLSGMTAVVITVAGVALLVRCTRRRCRVHRERKTGTAVCDSSSIVPPTDYSSVSECEIYRNGERFAQLSLLESPGSDTSTDPYTDIGTLYNDAGTVRERPAKPLPLSAARADSFFYSSYVDYAVPYQPPTCATSAGQYDPRDLSTEEELHLPQAPFCLSSPSGCKLYSNIPMSTMPAPAPPGTSCEVGVRHRGDGQSAGLFPAMRTRQLADSAAYWPPRPEREKQAREGITASSSAYESFQKSAVSAAGQFAIQAAGGSAGGLRVTETPLSEDCLDYNDVNFPCHSTSGSADTSCSDNAISWDCLGASRESLTATSSQTSEAHCASSPVFIRNALDEKESHAPSRLNFLKKSSAKDFASNAPLEPNLCCGDTRSSGTQTGTPAHSGVDLLGQPWQHSVLVSAAGARVSGPQSQVSLDVPRDCVSEPTIFHMAVHTCTEELTQRLLLDHPDLALVSPVAECRSGVGGTLFLKPVCLSLPFRGASQRSLQVLCFEVEANGSVSVRQVSTRAKDNRVQQDVFYQVSAPGLVTVFTRHFSLFACLACRQQLDVDLLVLAFTRHSKENSVDHWSTARVRLLVADKKFEIPDFQQRVMNDQAKEGFQFCGKKALNLQPQCGPDSFLLLRLEKQLKGQDAGLAWEHLSAQDQPLFPPQQMLRMEEVVNHCLRKEPKIVEWAMTRRGAGNSCLSCAVQIIHGNGGAEEDLQGRPFTRNQGLTVLLLDDIPVKVLSLEGVKRGWLDDASMAMYELRRPHDWDASPLPPEQAASSPSQASGSEGRDGMPPWHSYTAATAPPPPLAPAPQSHSADGSHTQPKALGYLRPADLHTHRPWAEGGTPPGRLASGQPQASCVSRLLHPATRLQGVSVGPRSPESQEDKTYLQAPPPCLGPSPSWTAQGATGFAHAHIPHAHHPQESSSSGGQSYLAFPELRPDTEASWAATFHPRALPHCPEQRSGLRHIPVPAVAQELGPGLQPGSYGTREATLGLQPGSYGTGEATLGLQPGSYGTGEATLGLQPGSYGTREATLGLQPGSYGTGEASTLPAQGLRLSASTPPHLLEANLQLPGLATSPAMVSSPRPHQGTDAHATPRLSQPTPPSPPRRHSWSHSGWGHGSAE